MRKDEMEQLAGIQAEGLAWFGAGIGSGDLKRCLDI